MNFKFYTQPKRKSEKKPTLIRFNQTEHELIKIEPTRVSPLRFNQSDTHIYI